MIEVTMDQLGRVEIPEDIRKCLGLNPGSKLEIALDRLEEIRLRPLSKNGEETNHAEDQGERRTTRLVRENGVLVADIVPIDDSLRYYLEHAVELDREERMRKLMGETMP